MTGSGGSPGLGPTRVEWFRSLRVPIALAVALVSMACVAAVGTVVEYRSAVDGRERLRAQAFDRLEAAELLYLNYGKLRAGATLQSDGVPPELLSKASLGGKQVSYFQDPTMWAAHRISDDKVLVIEMDGRELNDSRDALRSSLIQAGLIAVPLSAVLGWLVAAGLSRRLRRGAIAAREIAAGDRQARAAQRGSDEVAVLTQAVDHMADALGRRLELERQFTADVAHELRTPVTALVSSTELLGNDRVAQLVRNQVNRLRLLVADLLEISRLESGREEVNLVPADLASVVRAALEPLGDQPPVDVEVVSSAVVLVELRRVDRVIANLVTNARRHGGVTCRVIVEGIRVRVQDDGPGFPADILSDGPRRFSSHGHGSGTGLGLTIATRQAAVMDGLLTFVNMPGGGACAQLTLKRAAAQLPG